MVSVPESGSTDRRIEPVPISLESQTSANEPLVSAIGPELLSVADNSSPRSVAVSYLLSTLTIHFRLRVEILMKHHHFPLGPSRLNRLSLLPLHQLPLVIDDPELLLGLITTGNLEVFPSDKRHR